MIKQVTAKHNFSNAHDCIFDYLLNDDYQILQMLTIDLNRMYLWVSVNESEGVNIWMVYVKVFFR